MQVGAPSPANGWLNAHTIDPHDVAMFAGRNRSALSQYGVGRHPVPEVVSDAVLKLAKQRGNDDTEAEAIRDRYVALCDAAYLERHNRPGGAMMRSLARFGDWMSLGDFAGWLDSSNAVATATLNDLSISFVRIGSRGQFRISTASVARAFGVPMNENDDDGEAEIANVRLPSPSLPSRPCEGRFDMSKDNDDSIRPAVKTFADQLGLEPEVLDALGVRQWKQSTRMVAFPCRDHHGDLVSAQLRDLDQSDLEAIKKRWLKGHGQWTFGAEDIDPLKPLILVEGAVDWLLGRSMRYSIVGLPSATFKVENAEWLDQFDECEEWIVLNEGGSAATKMLNVLAGSKYADRITVFTLGHRDIYDIWKTEGRDPVAAKAVIDAAIEGRVPLADHLRPSGWEELHSTERIRTIKWNGNTWTAQYTPTDRGGSVDLRVTDDEDNLKRRDSIIPTGSSIEFAAKALDKTGIVPNGQSSLGVLEDIVYGLLASQATDEFAVTNLLVVPEDEDEDDDPLLVGPFVVLDAASAAIGPTGSTKSIAAVAQSLSVVSGQRIGPYEPTGPPQPVLYLNGEASERDIREIALAIGREHGIDVASLVRDGMFHHRIVKTPIIGNPETYRRIVERGEYGLMIVDSVDTARGADATNLSGEYYDVLRYIGGTSLSIDHVSKEMAKKKMAEWDTFGSVRAVNRPRQTWAMKALPPKNGVVTIRARRNFVNRGVVGLEFEYDMRFTMTAKGRFRSIHFSDPTGVTRAKPTNQDA